jgi:hypothetical protein
VRRQASDSGHAEARAGRPVTLTSDPTQDATDRFGRTLAYVNVVGCSDVGRSMVATVYVFEAPFARLATLPPRRTPRRQPRAGHGVPAAATSTASARICRAFLRRTGRDSNPRWSYKPHTRLEHAGAFRLAPAARKRCKSATSAQAPEDGATDSAASVASVRASIRARRFARRRSSK